MIKYHAVWLSAHPTRTAHWLAARIAEGFEIHHVDRDRSNNHPDNLVLIDGEDHARLHGRRTTARPNRGASARRKFFGKAAYAKRRDEGLSWGRIGYALGTTEPQAIQAAWEYSQINGLAWPPISTQQAAHMRQMQRDARLKAAKGE